MSTLDPSSPPPTKVSSPIASADAPLGTNDYALARDMSTSKVGGIAPDHPEGSSASADTPRFMTSNWSKDPENYQFGRSTFWAWTVNRLRYKGAHEPRTGKMGVFSALSQRTSSLFSVIQFKAEWDGAPIR